MDRRLDEADVHFGDAVIDLLRFDGDDVLQITFASKDNDRKLQITESL